MCTAVVSNKYDGMCLHSSWPLCTFGDLDGPVRPRFSLCILLLPAPPPAFVLPLSSASAFHFKERPQPLPQQATPQQQYFAASLDVSAAAAALFPLLSPSLSVSLDTTTACFSLSVCAGPGGRSEGNIRHLCLLQHLRLTPTIMRGTTPKCRTCVCTAVRSNTAAAATHAMEPFGRGLVRASRRQHSSTYSHTDSSTGSYPARTDVADMLTCSTAA